jgi:hypothetical protein
MICSWINFFKNIRIPISVGREAVRTSKQKRRQEKRREEKRREEKRREEKRREERRREERGRDENKKKRETEGTNERRPTETNNISKTQTIRGKGLTEYQQ